MEKEFYGKWQIVKKLGEGGQGAVFKVRDATKPDPLAKTIKEFAADLNQVFGTPDEKARTDRANALAEKLREIDREGLVGSYAALKLLHLPRSGDFLKAMSRMRNEVAVYEKINHPNLIKIIDKDFDERW